MFGIPVVVDERVAKNVFAVVGPVRWQVITDPHYPDFPPMHTVWPPQMVVVAVEEGEDEE